jgi:hypothetical protein
MSEVPMDAATAMDLLQQHLHPKSPEMIGLVFQWGKVSIEPEADPELLNAAQALVRIGALEVTEGTSAEPQEGPWFVFTAYPQVAIARWVCSLNN